MDNFIRAKLIELVDNAAGLEGKLERIRAGLDDLREQLDDRVRALAQLRVAGRPNKTAAAGEAWDARVAAATAEIDRFKAELERQQQVLHVAHGDMQAALEPVRRLVAAAALPVGASTPHGRPLANARADELRALVLQQGAA